MIWALGLNDLINLLSGGPVEKEETNRHISKYRKLVKEFVYYNKIYKAVCT